MKFMHNINMLDTLRVLKLENTSVSEKDVYDYEQFSNEIIMSLCTALQTSNKKIDETLMYFLNHKFDVFDGIEDLDIMNHTNLYYSMKLGEMNMAIKIFEHMSDVNAKNAFISKAMHASKYGESIIHIIYQEEGISHGQLAERLGLQKSNLTNRLKTLHMFDLFSIEKKGREKRYYLTKNGHDVQVEFMRMANRNRMMKKAGNHRGFELKTILTRITTTDRLAEPIYDQIEYLNPNDRWNRSSIRMINKTQRERVENMER